jgi:hypothetical protein
MGLWMERLFLWTAMLVALIGTASVFWIYEFNSSEKVSKGSPSSLSVSAPPVVEDRTNLKSADQAKVRITHTPNVKIPVRPRTSAEEE